MQILIELKIQIIGNLIIFFIDVVGEVYLTMQKFILFKMYISICQFFKKVTIKKLQFLFQKYFYIDIIYSLSFSTRFLVLQLIM